MMELLNQKYYFLSDTAWLHNVCVPTPEQPLLEFWKSASAV